MASRVKGLDQLSKELRKLGPDIGKKVLRSATSAALTPTFKKIKASAPVGSVRLTEHSKVVLLVVASCLVA